MKKLLLIYIKSEWYSIDTDNFEDFRTRVNFDLNNIYITFQTADLIREFTSLNVDSLPSIIDLESYDKQMSQEGKEFRYSSKWQALSFLRHQGAIDSDFRLTTENVKPFMELLSTEYKKLSNKDDREMVRFSILEKNINQLIYERQMLGVDIDFDIAKKRCVELEKEIYSIKNKLQLNYRIFTPNNTKTQEFYLKEKDYRKINTLIDTFKIHRKEDEVCNLLYLLIRNQQDLDSFLFILSHWGGEEKTYPSYYGFGTITSRIIQREPCLQNLRRINRDVIIPEFGKKLLYVDYSQFEAGILASLSNDEKLIELYNSDIYDDLAKNALDDPQDRKQAKITFYRYMYGDKKLDKRAQNYFKGFNELVKYKNNIESQLIKDRKIGTPYGNYRYSLEDNADWALSHIVQSTASYIYKMALIEVHKKVKSTDFLIPMHDGTVYQIEKDAYEESKTEIEEIYKAEFKKVCPSIDIRVTSSEKFE